MIPGSRLREPDVESRSLQAKPRRLPVSHSGGVRRRIRQRRVTLPTLSQLLQRRPRGTRRSGSTPALQATASGGSAAEEVDQLASLPIGQTAERLRVSDPTLGEDSAGSDRADLRHHQEDIADPRRPHTGGWVGEGSAPARSFPRRAPFSASLSPSVPRSPAPAHADAVRAICPERRHGRCPPTRGRFSSHYRPVVNHAAPDDETSSRNNALAPGAPAHR